MFDAQKIADHLFALCEKRSTREISDTILALVAEERTQIIKALEAKKQSVGDTTGESKDYWMKSAAGSSMSMDKYNDNEYRNAESPHADNVHSVCNELISMIRDCAPN